MKYLLPILLSFFFLFNYSCKPSDDFDTSSNVMLEFSADTLHFDTVFTELGSATRILKVYNRGNKDIQISKISVKDDPNSFFKVNIDGITGNVATDVKIGANDSMYIFAEVTIDPDQPLSLSPFVIEDYLVFEVNGNVQELLMEAWGQNANYYPDRFSKGEVTTIGCNGGDFVLSDPKPWVFYGTVVFQNCNVIIPAGRRIHVHGGVVPTFDADSMRTFFNDGRIVLFEGSSLNVEGTQDEPVVISGDRLESSFEDVAGQWWGIYLFQGSGNHKIEHLEVKNSIVGIVVDSTDLEITSSQIYNTSNAGLIGIHSEINATNCLFYNNGSNAVRMIYGGDYDFTYCTLASYGVDASALTMSNWLCRQQNELGQCISCSEYRLNANFQNSIIFGSKRDEIDISDGDDCSDGASSPLNYTFENCIVRVDELVDEGSQFENFFDFCDPCQNGDNNDALFLDTNEDDYHLDTLSIAERRAVSIGGINEDLDGFTRGLGGESPDVGCYEYQY